MLARVSCGSRLLTQIVLSLALSLGSSLAAAAPVELLGFGITPPAPTTADFVSLGGTIQYATAGYDLVTTDLSIPEPASFFLNILVSSPAPGEPVAQIITTESVSVSLGQLPVGDYAWTVNVFTQQRETGIQTQAASAAGFFSVTPEPSPLALLACVFALYAGSRKLLKPYFG